MARLFVAVDLPRAVVSALVAVQPSKVSGVRLVTPDRMHVTLHFIGDAESDRMAAALDGVAAHEFSLSIQGVGRFQSGSGGVTLWAGIRDCPELQSLHTKLAAALSVEGFRPERRPLTPHVTLARCGPDVPADLVDTFLNRNANFSVADVPITAFSLYSSEFVGNTPVYRCVREFPLLARGRSE